MNTVRLLILIACALFASTATSYGASWSPMDASDGFRSPQGIAVDPATHAIYVVDTEHCRVVVFSNGVQIGAFGALGTDVDEFYNPRAGAIDTATDSLYISDTLNNRISVYSRNGSYKNTFTANLNRPAEIAVDTDGHIFVADSNNARIKELSPTGELLTTFGTTGNAPGQFKAPYGIAILGDELVITDVSRGNVQIFAKNGTYKRTLATFGAEPPYVASPRGVTVAPNSNIYVCDYAHGEIDVFTQDSYITSIQNVFTNPSGIAFSADGTAFVVDATTNLLYTSPQLAPAPAPEPEPEPTATPASNTTTLVLLICAALTFTFLKPKEAY